MKHTKPGEWNSLPMRPKFHFLKISADEAQQFAQRVTRGSSSDLMVWMLALNALRVEAKDQLRFTPRWRHGIDLQQKTVYRSLKRLHKAGLLSVQFRKGKSPIVGRGDNSLPPESEQNQIAGRNPEDDH
jgi:hypothetical protein